MRGLFWYHTKQTDTQHLQLLAKISLLATLRTKRDKNLSAHTIKWNQFLLNPFFERERAITILTYSAWKSPYCVPLVNLLVTRRQIWRLGSKVQEVYLPFVDTVTFRAFWVWPSNRFSRFFCSLHYLQSLYKIICIQWILQAVYSQELKWKFALESI